MPRIWLIGRSWPTPSARPVEIGPAKTCDLLRRLNDLGS